MNVDMEASTSTEKRSSGNYCVTNTSSPFSVSFAPLTQPIPSISSVSGWSLGGSLNTSPHDLQKTLSHM
jgi:hypothetical protein